MLQVQAQFTNLTHLLSAGDNCDTIIIRFISWAKLDINIIFFFTELETGGRLFVSLQVSIDSSFPLCVRVFQVCFAN